MLDKIWANSGDSHFLEPADLFDRRPAAGAGGADAARGEGPRRQWETVHIDGQSFRRPLPRADRDGEFAARRSRPRRPPGANDTGAAEGPRPGGHLGGGRLPLARHVGRRRSDPVLVREALEARQRLGHRVDPEGARRARRRPRRSRCSTSTDAVAEMERAAGLGLPRGLPADRAAPGAGRLDNRRHWEPLWAAAEEAGMVLALPHRHRARRRSRPRRLLPRARAARSSTTSRRPTAASGPS